MCLVAPESTIQNYWMKKIGCADTDEYILAVYDAL